MFQFTVIKTTSKSNLGRKGFLASYTSGNGPALRKVRAGTWGQELEQRNTVYRLAPVACSACFCIASRTTSQGVTVHGERSPPTSVNNQNQSPTHWLAYRPGIFSGKTPSSQIV